MIENTNFVPGVRVTDVQLAIADGAGSFVINPMSLVAGPKSLVHWYSDHPFVIRFIGRTPFRGVARHSQRAAHGGHELEGTIVVEEAGVFDYAAALSLREDDMEFLEIHTSGEIIVDPGGNW